MHHLQSIGHYIVQSYDIVSLGLGFNNSGNIRRNISYLWITFSVTP